MLLNWQKKSVNVKGMVVIFTYGFEISEKNFLKNNIELRTLGIPVIF